MTMADLRDSMALRSLRFHFFLAMALLAGFATLGCNRASRGVPVPKFKPAAASDAVIQQYDTDGDEQLSASEISACVVLAGSAEQIDITGDGLVSSEEIADHIRLFASSRMGVVRVVCHVYLDKKPLAGANITFQPAEFLGESIVPAMGKTLANGKCGITMDSALLPKELSRVRGVQPGFYKVLITHDRIDIPTRYNEQTTLGVEVSQKLITDRGVRFDLKTKR